MLNVSIQFVCLLIALAFTRLVYKLVFHPLRRIPGPKLNAVSRLPYLRHHLDGSAARYSRRLHERYGEVVRFSPNEVSFITAQAWPDIYGPRTGKWKGHEEMSKDPAWYGPPLFKDHPPLLIAPQAYHGRLRKLFANAFSEKALAEQEPLLQQYSDQLVARLREQSSQGQVVDMTEWMNWVTFDVISDFLFGEPFGCLQNLESHKYVELSLKRLQSAPLFYCMCHYPFTRYLAPFFFGQNKLAARAEFGDWINAKVTARCDSDTDRPDFIKFIMEHNEKDKDAALSHTDLTTNISLLIAAGSETSATALVATLYLLSKHPEVANKVRNEIKSGWQSYDQITIASVIRLPYLSAVISEALRLLPPASVGFQRVVPEGGEIISGHFIPEGTGVSVSHYSAYRSAEHFSSPDTFAPERWLEDSKYSVNREVFQPFSFGPRGCLGKNFANAEMRLILAKLIWSFHFELDRRSSDWMDRCIVQLTWTKPELWMRLREINGMSV